MPGYQPQPKSVPLLHFHWLSKRRIAPLCLPLPSPRLPSPSAVRAAETLVKSLRLFAAFNGVKPSGD